MSYIEAKIDYTLKVNGHLLEIDDKKFNLLKNIRDEGSISKASQKSNISYRTALNYIEQMEEQVETGLINTKKGGKGGGGSAKLSRTGELVLRECRKFNAVMTLHKNVNEIDCVISEIDRDKGVMKIKISEGFVSIPLKKGYSVGEHIIALISYEDVFIMLEPQKSSVRNIFKGKITEMQLVDDMVRIKVDIGDIFLFADITESAKKELNLNLGTMIYLGFKAASVAVMSP